MICFSLRRTSNVFKVTGDVLTDAFPILLEGLRQASDAIPTPAGPIVKGVVQSMIFIMTKAEVSWIIRSFEVAVAHYRRQEYKKSNRDIYCLSARAAQVVIAIINSLEPGPTNAVRRYAKAP